MKHTKVILFALMALSLSSFAQTSTEAFVNVSTADNQSQGMAMVLATQMLSGLLKAGATVEVCALFLPNADRAPTDLTDGVTVAKPPEVAAYMLKPGVRAFGF